MESEELLTRAGRLLYGQRWIPQLSKALGLPNGEVRLWHSGRRKIPAVLWLDLRRLLRIRQRELSALQREIRAEIDRDDEAP
jgi:hypothetical protein